MDKTLTEILTTQLQLLEELRLLLERETRELGDMNLEAMAEVNRLKEELTGRIEAHTGPLRQAIAAAARAAGLGPDATLGAVVAATREKGIPRLYRELNDAARQVQERAALNRDIAERFMATVGTSLNFLTRLLNQASVYGASGGYQQQRPTGASIINKEA
ncbi:flagellar protein FlgN [Geobacter sp. FeAm09]|uniref:flagellar export chaperone FlgN n=1 Tax=Geobacter sp. FeAm09 TaxID=2597769 RepID=UPI0011EBE332|nr:flagellar export chaperone FlgN [Geobacter sp. FeAm09]QEM69863.1 flagellar protein FlgN [Geobacter sp. FeAm09]